MNKKDFWKSLKDYNDSEEIRKIKENEFMEGVTEDFDPDKLSKLSRRKFLALVSATAAIGATACTDYRDKGEIIPYNKKPEHLLPGKANYYASSCAGCSSACGVLIKTREGRPIKVDGNPEHPINRGKLCAKGQASIYNLYDPERLRYPVIKGRRSDWKRVDSEIVDALKKAVDENKEIALFAGNVKSPSALRVMEQFKKKYPTAKIYSYQLFNEGARQKAWKISYGSSDYSAIRWEKADVILSVEGDFLGSEGNYVENARRFSQGRDIVNNGKLNRLYAAESRMSLTGMMADYRLRVSPLKQFNLLMGLANVLYKKGSQIELPSDFESYLGKFNLAEFKNDEKIKLLIEDLDGNRGKSIVYTGSNLPVEMHLAANLLNEILGNTELYDTKYSFVDLLPLSEMNDIRTLCDNMRTGNVGVVIHLDTNPVFHLPADFRYADALKSVPTVVTITSTKSETADLSGYVLPESASFESWGDYYARSGVYGLQQPVIAPLFDTRQKEAILLRWSEGIDDEFNDGRYRDFIAETCRAQVYEKIKPASDFKAFWYASLHDGFVEFNESAEKLVFNPGSLKELMNTKVPAGEYTLLITESYFVGDGKYANNGWLQELPHPVTKVTWDNYLSISPATAKKMNLEMNDMAEVSYNGVSLKLPVFVQPGMSDDTLHIEAGYGRKSAGVVGEGVGFNPLVFITKNSDYSPFIQTGVKLNKSEGKYTLASTQEHHSLDDTFVKDFHRIRKIIQEGTLPQYEKNHHFLHEEKHELFSITDEHKYDGVKWAMAIDLNKCTGCNACVASCNVENNVPVVGKDQVAKGREMQWIRIDRYYSGTPDEPVVSNQPMLCQHCDNAPCENVCPVNATNHSPDGLNQMVYNRCVGTRYCSNNCPYKVRRFNFYNYRDHFEDSYYENELTSLVNNPEVTVRSRGVMEKCTFCIQRIMEARSEAIARGEEFKGAGIQTACQQACPSEAIVFGNVNDPNSEIAKLRGHDLAYHVLETLNVKPNISYLAKIRNIHTEEIQ